MRDNEIANRVALIDDIAQMDPICHSREGINDDCHFCGAWGVFLPNYPSKHMHYYYAIHETDCAWVRARQYSGRTLFPHSVKERANVVLEGDGVSSSEGLIHWMHPSGRTLFPHSVKERANVVLEGDGVSSSGDLIHWMHQQICFANLMALLTGKPLLGGEWVSADTFMFYFLKPDSQD
jgi:hypothetical protein